MHVLACPRCDRQYDATHLDPGSRIRCLCDESIVVRRPAELPVTALVCTHCGGPVGASDLECPYCEAALAEKDRREAMPCPVCFERIPDGRACPRCGGRLGLLDLGRTSVVDCISCGGLWLRPEAFEEVCRAAREEPRGSGRGWRERDSDESVREPVRYIPCLACGELMTRRQFRYRDSASRVVVDVCRGHGIWLDRDELQRIAAFIGERSAMGRVGPIDDGAFLEGREPPRKPLGKPSAVNWLEGPEEKRSPVVTVLEVLGAILFGFGT
jgi:hypothetical protein